MKSIPYILFLITALFLIQCSDEDSPTPPVVCNDISTCDSCGTYEPVAWGDTTIPIGTIYGMRKSPTDNIYAVCSYTLNGTSLVYLWEPEIDSIYNISGVGFRYIGGQWAEWSSNGRKLILFEGIYNISINTSMWWPSFLEPYNQRTFVWSVDNEWIYMSSDSDTYKMHPDATDITLVAKNFTGARQLNDSLLVTLQEDALYTYNMNTNLKQRLEFSKLPDNLIFNTKEHEYPWMFYESNRSYWDLSPDRTKIIADIEGKTPGVSREERGLYCFDLEKQTMRHVLVGQYWGQKYWPRWASNTSFYATYYCRKDDVSMVYEFDLNGKTLRQITFKEEGRFYTL